MKIKYKIPSIIGVFCLLLLPGCERGSVTDENFPGVGSDELIPISVHVDGIEDFYGGAVTRGGVTEESFRQALDTLRDSGYDVVTTYETVQPEHSVQTRATLANVRFRLLAYKNSISAANYAGQCDYLTNGSGVAAAQTTTMKLKAGNYVFVCYSYGTNAALAAFNGASATTISVANGQDFMTWKSGTVSVAMNADGQYSLSGISFTRQCSQLEICVQVTGLTNSNVTSCAATVSGLSDTPANWTIGADDISTTGAAGSVNITWPSIDSPTVYSNTAIILPASNRAVTVKLTTLRANNNTEYDNKVMATTVARQFLKGGYYRITLKVEKNSILACSYNWAKANLKSSGEFESSPTAYGGYFGWNTTSMAAGEYNSGVYSAANDPCYQAAPVGTWYTPSQDQLNNLLSCKSSGWENGWYFADKTIFLPAAGFRYEDGSTDYLGKTGDYWTRDVSGKYGVYLEFTKSGIGTESYYRHYGHPVRCVKGL